MGSLRCVVNDEIEFVMPGLVPGIHVFLDAQDVDGRDKKP
jgi:hypothetical protein